MRCTQRHTLHRSMYTRNPSGGWKSRDPSTVGYFSLWHNTVAPSSLGFVLSQWDQHHRERTSTRPSKRVAYMQWESTAMQEISQTKAMHCKPVSFSTGEAEINRALQYFSAPNSSVLRGSCYDQREATGRGAKMTRLNRLLRTSERSSHRPSTAKRVT